MSSRIGKQRHERLLDEMSIHRNGRKIWRDVEFHTSILQSRECDRFAQKFGGVAPFAHRLQESGFQPRRIEQVIDRARESTHGLLQLGAVRLRLLQASPT